MTFAYSLPWWALILIVLAASALAVRTYAGVATSLSRRRRAVLATVRVLILLLLVAFVLRPMVPDVDADGGGSTVVVLVDVSRSMGLADEDELPRVDRAAALVRDVLVPSLEPRFEVEVLSFGESLAPADLDDLSPDARLSDVGGAIRGVRERFRGRPLSGIVLFSDGGDTGDRDASTAVEEAQAPIYAVGLGSRRLHRDREVLNVTAGDAALTESVIDLSASVVSHGFGTDPIELRVLENGRPIHVRRVVPPADGAPVREVFQVSPQRDSATLYTVEVPLAAGELVVENNARSVLVRPPGRTRRILMVEGAPGYEHSFLKRALASDAGLEVDSVVRKGQNDRGDETFYVQAEAMRAAPLLVGYPMTRETLFAYDAVVFANIEADFFTTEQLALTADFVSARGGGLLVLGARSFDRHGLIGTPIEEVLPVELSDREGTPLRAAITTTGPPNKVELTADGRRHPLMQIGMSAHESEDRWEALPALASSAPLGGPRPGASILAVTPAPGGLVRPVVAVQRYGSGRAMIFGGEAAWRWRMMLPSTDRSYETFWRQAVRWLSTAAPDPVSVVVSGGATAGDPLVFDVMVRDRTYAPVRDANVRLEVTTPDGRTRDLTAALSDSATGRYATRLVPDQSGVHRVQVDARRNLDRVASLDEWLLVGGSDPEMTDPRLNDEVLRRLAVASGGRFLEADELGALAALLQERPAGASPVMRDAWHNGWVFALLILLLSGEWILRRRWGLR